MKFKPGRTFYYFVISKVYVVKSINHRLKMTEMFTIVNLWNERIQNVNHLASWKQNTNPKELAETCMLVYKSNLEGNIFFVQDILLFYSPPPPQFSRTRQQFAPSWHQKWKCLPTKDQGLTHTQIYKQTNSSSKSFANV